MTIFRYPIVRPQFPTLWQIAKPFEEALRTGQVTNNGRYVQEFERALEEYLGTHVCVVSSGQTALMLLLAAIDVRGKEVICPSFTFWGTPAAIHWAGGIPVFADIMGKTPLLCPGKTYEQRSLNTGAVIAVDVYGLSNIYKSWNLFSDAEKIPIVFDSAPAFGTLYGDSPIGAHGRGQIFSFHATKPFSTMEGGCISSSDRDLIERCRSLRNFGQIDAHGHSYGLNGKMTEICALIGLERLRTWPQDRAARVVAGQSMRAILSHLEGITLPSILSGSEPIWCYMPVILDRGIDREAVIRHMAAAGVETRKYYLPCHREGSLPVTEDIAPRVLALPVYNHMGEDEIADICEALQGAVRKER